MDDNMPTVVGEYYRIVDEKGSGSFSHVYSAIHQKINRLVAIKSVSKDADVESIEHFKNEIKIIEQLSHPYILQSFQSFEDDINYYHVTELAENGSLFEYLNNEGALPENEAKFMFHQLLTAVEYLHLKKRTVHRDLKLENVLLDKEKRIRLIDFGFSAKFDENALFNAMVGSPAYVAPEIALGRKYDLSVDVWSLGIILYAMVVGRLPFHGTTVEMQLKRVVLVQPFFPPQLTEQVVSLLKKLLQKDPSKRIRIEDIREHQWLKTFDNKDDQIIELYQEKNTIIDQDIVNMIDHEIDETNLIEGNKEIISKSVSDLKHVMYKILMASKIRLSIHQLITKPSLPSIVPAPPRQKIRKLSNEHSRNNENVNNENTVPQAVPIKAKKRSIFKSTPRFLELFKRH